MLLNAAAAAGVALLAGCATSADSPYGSIMDIYNAACDASAFTIFVDMYHAGYVEQAAVPGFTIVAPGAN